jgi:predicted AAA+ superfamily ATPase
VVIDHRLARIYQDLGSSRPKREDAMKPYDPHGFHRHLIHRKEAHYEGQRIPEETSFYEQIAEDLKPANEIVLIGHGTGKSSALGFLVEYLKTHHSTILPQVIATEVADLSALTEPEIEAIAKQHL